MSDPAAWCARLGTALTDVGDGIGRLAGQVSRDWSDAEGALRADRLTMLQRSVLRDAEDAAELGTRLERAAAGVGPLGDLTALLVRLAAIGTSATRPSGQRDGVVLGDVEGSRAAERPGMQLPDTSGS